MRKSKLTLIFSEKEDITTNTTDIQRIIRSYYEQLHTNKLEDLEEEKVYLTYQDCRRKENLSRPITSNEIK